MQISSLLIAIAIYFICLQSDDKVHFIKTSQFELSKKEKKS